VNWAIHAYLLKGVCLGFEIVDGKDINTFFIIDLLIIRIGIEIEKAHTKSTKVGTKQV